jgi:hypothetical protein
LVAGLRADVGVVSQGRVGLAAARAADKILSLLRVRTAEGGQGSRVARFTAKRLSVVDRGLSSFVYGYEDAYPMALRRQAGVELWWPETMLPRATMMRVRIDLLKNIVTKVGYSSSCLGRSRRQDRAANLVKLDSTW